MQGITPRIAGVVILYYPDAISHQRINTYLPYLDKLFVIDNSENPQPLTLQSEKLVYLSDRMNKGIASRLNQAATLAISERYDWLLSMDQDSSFSSENINNYLRCLRDFTGSDQVAVFGVNFETNITQPAVCKGAESLYLITSGSLINLKLFKKIGGFDENLFIDHVDFDYSFRSNLRGYKTIQFPNIYMTHQIGSGSSGFSFKNFKRTKRSLHSPMRIYYMTRNYLYVRSKYRRLFPQEVTHLKKDLLNRLKNNFIYDPRRLAVISNFLAGIADYFRNKMGKR